MTTARTISVREARDVADAAIQHAAELGVAVAVAVVDAGGHPVVVLRSDGASFLTTSLATAKAGTSAGLGVPTREFGAYLATEPSLLAGLAGQPGIAIVPGGLPLVLDGALVGAVGVAGGQGGEDHPVAAAGAAALVPVTAAG